MASVGYPIPPSMIVGGELDTHPLLGSLSIDTPLWAVQQPHSLLDEFFLPGPVRVIDEGEKNILDITLHSQTGSDGQNVPISFTSLRCRLGDISLGLIYMTKE